MKAEIKIPVGRIVVLEMTETEAQTLAIVCQLVGGTPEKSRRGDMDNFRHALKSIGIELPEDYTVRKDDNITFTDIE